MNGRTFSPKILARGKEATSKKKKKKRWRGMNGRTISPKILALGEEATSRYKVLCFWTEIRCRGPQRLGNSHTNGRRTPEGRHMHSWQKLSFARSFLLPLFRLPLHSCRIQGHYPDTVRSNTPTRSHIPVGCSYHQTKWVCM